LRSRLVPSRARGDAPVMAKKPKTWAGEMVDTDEPWDRMHADEIR
jgi:hypothetical protein